jgi:hypothetical protein
MKTLTKSEKEIVDLIVVSNNKQFSNLIIDVIRNCKIVCDKVRKRITIHYSTEGFTPTREEMMEIEKSSQILLRRIFQSVHVVEKLINEGYISLYNNQSEREITVLGDERIQNLGILQHIEDEHIRNLFLSFCDQTLIVYSDLKEYIRNGYRTKHEYREIWQLRLSWTGIIIAFTTAIISILLSLNNSHERNIEKTLTIIQEQEKIENIKIDSLLYDFKDFININLENNKLSNDYYNSSLMELRAIHQVNNKILKTQIVNR